MAVDGSGVVTLAGHTASSNFPRTEESRECKVSLKPYARHGNGTDLPYRR
jgi:hypothetical protein